MNPFSHQAFSISLAALVGPLAAAAMFCGCDRRDTPAEGRGLTGSSAFGAAPAGGGAAPGEALFDAGAAEPLVDPPAPAGNLGAEIEQFTTIDRCVESRVRLDPVVGDALEAIGYDTLLVDACRVLDAAKARDGRRCEAVDASPLRSRCHAVIAELAGSADDCPWQIPSRPARGRDPACVAIASRDPRLCAGAPDAFSRATCAAIVRQGAGACASLTSKGDRARCAREAERWGLLAQGLPQGGEGKTLAAPAGRLKVEAGDAQPPLDQDLGGDLERGVVLVEQRDGTRLVIGPVSETGPGFIAASPHVRATFGVELFVPKGERTSGARVERVELVLPGRPALATPGAHSTIVAKIATIEHARGGAVTLSLEGDLGDSIATCRVHLEASTFVRDVVKDSAIFAPVAPPGGTGRGVR